MPQKRPWHEPSGAFCSHPLPEQRLGSDAFFSSKIGQAIQRTPFQARSSNIETGLQITSISIFSFHASDVDIMGADAIPGDRMHV
jgi:hypothetical protein